MYTLLVLILCRVGFKVVDIGIYIYAMLVPNPCRVGFKVVNTGIYIYIYIRHLAHFRVGVCLMCHVITRIVLFFDESCVGLIWEKSAPRAVPFKNMRALPL